MADQSNLLLGAVTSGKLGTVAPFGIADASGSTIWNGRFSISVLSVERPKWGRFRNGGFWRKVFDSGCGKVPFQQA